MGGGDQCRHTDAYRPVDGGGHEDEVGPQQLLDQGQWDGCSLVNHQQLCLAQFHSIRWVDVLWARELGFKNMCSLLKRAKIKQLDLIRAG